MPKVKLRNLSKLITNLFHYYTWMPVVLVAGVFRAGLKTEHIKSTLGILIFLDVIAPILTYFFLLNGGKIADSSLVKRADRPLLFGIIACFVLVATLVSYFLGSTFFFEVHALFFVFIFTLFSITLFFKISGHAFLNSYFIFILNFLFGWNFIWLFLVVPVVALARLYLKAHTITEILAGTIVGSAEPYLMLKLFNLL